MSYKEKLQSNNTEINANNVDIQTAIDKVNALPDAGTQTYETCTVNVSGLLSYRGTVAYWRLKSTGEPVVWMVLADSFGAAKAYGAIKGSVIQCYSGDGSPLMYDISSGLEYIVSAIAGFGYAFNILETAGDTETVTITLD